MRRNLCGKFPLIITSAVQNVQQDSKMLWQGTKPTLVVCCPEEWFKLNKGQHGFYRVQYDDKLMALLGHAIKMRPWMPAIVLASLRMRSVWRRPVI